MDAIANGAEQMGMPPDKRMEKETITPTLPPLPAALSDGTLQSVCQSHCPAGVGTQPQGQGTQLPRPPPPQPSPRHRIDRYNMHHTAGVLAATHTAEASGIAVPTLRGSVRVPSTSNRAMMRLVMIYSQGSDPT